MSQEKVEPVNIESVLLSVSLSDGSTAKIHIPVVDNHYVERAKLEINELNPEDGLDLLHGSSMVVENRRHYHSLSLQVPSFEQFTIELTPADHHRTGQS